VSVQYFKRYRMEFDLEQQVVERPVLPEQYVWLPWRQDLLDRHASVKAQSFKQEIDAHVFPCLADYYGCLRLMQEIVLQRNFCPQSTWLVGTVDGPDQLLVECGTIQGICPSEYLGSIQNVGVIPGHRGVGLGRALVLKSLEGFRAAGRKRATLEVTATNHNAVELYRSLGFCVTRTMYREANDDLLIST
jgi:hypothetical protein